MTISNFPNSEPLFIIVMRDNNAHNILQKWVKENGIPATVDGNRMKFFETRSLSMFQAKWSGSWDDILIWDCWNKRHVY